MNRQDNSSSMRRKVSERALTSGRHDKGDNASGNVSSPYQMRKPQATVSMEISVA